MTDGISAALPATDGASRVAPAVWLRAALVAAVAAALVVTAFDLVVAEPVVDRAVALEDGHHAAVGVPEPFTRGEQRGGLVLAELLYALGAGLALSGVATLLGPVRGAARRWAALATGGAWSLAVVPLAAIPPLPPGVESAWTIDARRAVFGAAVVVGLAGAVGAAFLWRRLPALSARARLLAAGAPLAASLAIASLILPGEAIGDSPPGLVRDFRLVSVGGAAPPVGGARARGGPHPAAQVVVSAYGRLVRALGTTRAFAWVGARALHRLDAPFASRKRSVTSLGTGFPLCYLTVRGRTTGEPRTVPLLYLADGERVVLIASNWGRRRHPAWALNLDAAPEATVRVAGEARRMVARRASPGDVERYWAEALVVWPGYEGYRQRAGREVRIYVLDPA